MHNCKTTRERLTELLLDGVDPRAVLATDLRDCAECREECSELAETLRFTTRLIETATPPDSYWPGYHARLKERLRAAQQPRVELVQYQPSRQSWLTRLFFSSVRIPVPVGLALILVVGLAFMVSIRVPAELSEPLIVQVPVEVPVPVVQEKTVERIVYRERRSQRSKPTRTSSPIDPTVASLQGFTPTEEVKLTVIKGGSANEK
jgi:predicted anti-sigma-YlaC factor YlaD